MHLRLASSSAWVFRALCLLLPWILVEGCYYDAPQFEPKQQLPPTIFSSRVQPPVGEVYSGPIPFDISVPFRSEDVDESQVLLARFFVNLGAEPQAPTPSLERQVAGGHYEQEDRAVEVRWTEPIMRCSSLTMVLSYEENFAAGLPLDETRAAYVVWWILGEDEQATLDSCGLSSVAGG